MEAPQGTSPPSTSGCTRRSSRIKKAHSKHDEEYVVPGCRVPIQPPVKQTRPKRKAAQAATQSIIPEGGGPTLEEVLDQMSLTERQEYSGWVELESDPGFFGAMLVELGIDEAYIQEIYSLGPETWMELPQPVYGLIFLFEYEGDNEDHNEEDLPIYRGGLWFANQTTANACATVALMNIIMNSPILGGGYLNAFKNITDPMLPPHRGYYLDRDDRIRSVHNFLARRIDLLSEDLALDNKYEESQKKKKAQRKTPKKTAKSKRKKPKADTTYHYIAYVPTDDRVWELDGLQTKPRALGPIPQSPEGCWLDIAGAAIQERMLRNSEYSSYNLLAICQSPLKGRTREFGTRLYSCLALHKRDFGGNPSDRVPDPFETFPQSRLARLGLSITSIHQSFAPTACLKRRMEEPGFDNTKALALAKDFISECESLEVLVIAERESIHEMMGRFRSRQHDHTPGIHQWVRALAQKGVLRELIQETGSES
ncbi:cysteine proteinase [Hypoxylon sp. FL1150]|nr:cysteine proteinase [Hypoxylon sp. FL1150]